MSLILDALKKLDREKSSGRGQPGNLALDILKPDSSLSSKRIPLYLAAFFITAVAAAAITYGVIAGFGFRSESRTSAAVKLPQPSQPTASSSQNPISPPKSLPSGLGELPAPHPQGSPAPPEAILPSKSLPTGPAVVPIPSYPSAPAAVESIPPSKAVAPATADPRASVQQVTLPPLPREPVRDDRGEKSPVSPPIQAPPEGKPTAPAAGEDKASPGVISERVPAAAAMSRKTAEQTLTVPATAQPPLKLSGILWHENPLERRAVINGAVLTEGNVIEGVKVLEIHPTHVRLSHKDRHFEISLFK